MSCSRGQAGSRASGTWLVYESRRFFSPQMRLRRAVKLGELRNVRRSAHAVTAAVFGKSAGELEIGVEFGIDAIERRAVFDRIARFFIMSTPAPLFIARRPCARPVRAEIVDGSDHAAAFGGNFIVVGVVSVCWCLRSSWRGRGPSRGCRGRWRNLGRRARPGRTPILGR